MALKPVNLTLISPEPSPSGSGTWVLNEDTCQWEPPVEYPNDGDEYGWNEDTKSWSLVCLR